MTTPKTRSSNKGLMTHLTVAGTAALAAANANAQIIVNDVNVDIGYGPGEQSSFISSLPGLSQFVIAHGNPANNGHFVSAFGTSAPNAYLAFKTARTSYGLFETTKSPAGQRFHSAPGNVSTFAGFASVLRTVSATTGGATFNTTIYRGYTPFTDGYFLYTFTDTTNNNQIDYGYIKASLTDDTFNGLNLHISSYAYNLSGREVGAGEVPEPSAAVALAALSALTLGAVGVRRMKALQA